MKQPPKDIYEFIEEFVEICNQGKIPSHRAGDTGIGKTLEDLLNIVENDNQAPDFADYELKAHRINGSNSMITLFTRTPDIKGTNNKLREEFGYERADGKELHATLRVGVGTGDSQLGLIDDRQAEKVYISSYGNPIPYAYYSYQNLFEALHNKYLTQKAVFVSAYSYGPKTNEIFQFVDAKLLMGLDDNRFLNLLDDGIIKFDIRLGHYEDGRTHDHGSGFRILQKDEEKLFEHEIALYNAEEKRKIEFGQLQQLILEYQKDLK